MPIPDERELLEDDLERVVGDALIAATGSGPDPAAAKQVIAFLRQHRIVLYRRAERQLPDGLVQTTLMDFIPESEEATSVSR